MLKRTIETRGENLLQGLANMLKDIAAGQLTQTKKGAFEVGRNLATTPGKVVHETPLYQLIQYTPTTDKVLKTPVMMFPPWINRFYILDLTPEKSFVKWCVDQGISLFMVSWKSADESIADAGARRLRAQGQIDAIDTCARRSESRRPRDRLLRCRDDAGRDARLAPRQGQRPRSSPRPSSPRRSISPGGRPQVVRRRRDNGAAPAADREKGYLDGRYMAATFNLLRGRDLIWTYVVNNYLLGEEPAPFDLLHWNSDTTNLPAELAPQLSRDALQGEQAGRDRRDQRRGHADGHRNGEDADIRPGRPRGPYRAARKRVEDHGPFRRAKSFVLAGSGHIAGVVNPPAAQKYQYWINDKPAETLEAFIDGPRGSRRAAGGRTGSNG